MHIAVNRKSVMGGLTLAALAVGAACLFAIDKYKYEIGYNPITGSCAAYDIQKGPSYSEKWVSSHNAGGLHLGDNLDKRSVMSMTFLLFKPYLSEWENFRNKTKVGIVNGRAIVRDHRPYDISSAFLKVYGPKEISFSATTPDILNKGYGAKYVSSSLDGTSRFEYKGYYSYFGKPTLYFKTKGGVCGSSEYMAYGDYDQIYSSIIDRSSKDKPHLVIRQYGSTTTISIS